MQLAQSTALLNVHSAKVDRAHFREFNSIGINEQNPKLSASDIFLPQSVVVRWRRKENLGVAQGSDEHLGGLPYITLLWRIRSRCRLERKMAPSRTARLPRHRSARLALGERATGHPRSPLKGRERSRRGRRQRRPKEETSHPCVIASHH